MSVFTPDVSEFQVPVDDTFNRDWFSFRACFGDGKIDSHAAHNLAWAKQAKASGKIKGYSVYVVYLPGDNAGIVRELDTLGVPTDVPVMIDAERWSGLSYEIDGDHSAEINKLADLLRTRQGGRDDLVWAYGNRGPDITVWPNKAAWLGWVVASYGGSKPDVPNLLGWQYTDGESQYDRPDFPSSTPPFGRCDHNILFKIPEVDEVTADDIQKIVAAIKQATIDPAGDTVAGELRHIDNIASDVTALKKQVADLSAQVAKLQTGGVDADTVAKAVVAHLGIQVVAK